MEKSLLHRLTARFKHNKLLSYFLEKTGKDLKNKKWIFIVGCYNSGTTLLNEVLANHPSISGLPDEGVMLTNQLVKPEDFGWRRMWWKCEEEMKKSEVNSHKSPKVIKKQWSHFYKDKEFLLEKSISNTCRIPFFELNFAPAYFIHLVRNGYASAEGIRRKAEIIPGNPYFDKKQYPIDLCINQWTKSLKVVEHEKSKLNNFMEISYEELTENTVATMKKITDFLEIEECDPSILNSSFSVHGNQSEIKNMNENSFGKLDRKEIDTINDIAGEYLQKYNYKLL